MSYLVNYASSHKATVKLIISGSVASKGTSKAMRDLNLKVDSLAAEYEVGGELVGPWRARQSSLIEVVFESAFNIRAVREAALDLCHWLQNSSSFSPQD